MEYVAIRSSFTACVYRNETVLSPTPVDRRMWRHTKRVSNGAPPPPPPVPSRPARCCSRRPVCWARWMVAEWRGRAVRGAIGAALSGVRHVAGAALRVRQRPGARGARVGRRARGPPARAPAPRLAPRPRPRPRAASPPPTSTRTAAPTPRPPDSAPLRLSLSARLRVLDACVLFWAWSSDPRNQRREGRVRPSQPAVTTTLNLSSGTMSVPPALSCILIRYYSPHSWSYFQYKLKKNLVTLYEAKKISKTWTNSKIDGSDTELVFKIIEI